VRIGSISQGKIKCDSCGQVVPYAGRYLIIKEKKGVEDESGTPRSYCVKCARQKKYTQERNEKSDKVLSFFKDAIGPHAHHIAVEEPEEIKEEKEIPIAEADTEAAHEDDTEE
jgi:hypothetical protein